MVRSWPRAIAHVDADAFFASVEQAVRPALKGKPVVTGAERGIVAAASYEAKARGIQRGVPLWQVKHLCPDCVVLPSDYETYGLYSKRIFAIMRQFSPEVEEYSIDEGFADLTGLRRLYRTGYRGIGLLMQQAIARGLGITVSVGISLSKSLAKLCSKFRKPNGLTAVGGRHIHLLLERTPLASVWGFGPNSVALLKKHGLQTALDFIRRPESFASSVLGKVGRELWAELRGEYISRVSAAAPPPPMSITRSKTFTPPSADRSSVWAQALRNLESACITARRHGLAAQRIALFLRTQAFDHAGAEAGLIRPSSAANELAAAARELFESLFRPNLLYRATGVVLFDLADAHAKQWSLFEDPATALASERAFQAVDAAATRFGRHTVFLADGLRLEKDRPGDRAQSTARSLRPLKGETRRRRLGIPLLR